MKATAIIEASMGSSQLPGKVLLPLAGAPLLQRMIERVTASQVIARVVVATTSLPIDQPVRDLCRRLDVQCVAGHPTDLLERYYRTALRLKTDFTVRIPSTCPLVDPAIVDRVVTFFEEHADEYDYVSNMHPATYPDGNQVEVIPYETLYQAWSEAYRPYERERVTSFLWERPERFRIGNVRWDTGLNYSITHRWVVEYPEDYLLAKVIFENLWSPTRPLFSMPAIIDFLDQHPEIRDLNAEYTGVNWYRNHSTDSRSIAGDGLRKVV